MTLSKSLSAGLSDIGRVRQSNEDQFLIADLSKSMIVHASTLPVEDETRLFSGLQGQLLLVADGMGGRPGGTLASELTAATITHYVLNTMPWFFRLHHDHEDDLREELLAAMQRCEEVVEAEALARPEFDGMGTTLTMAYVVWPRLYVVHIGDSRCYLLRRGRLEQLTHDHTAAQAMVDQGTLTKDQAARSPLSHILVSSIGQGQSMFHPDVYRTELQPGDTILLCSDGLTVELSEDEITAILIEHESAEKAVDVLVESAKAAGGTDNITAVVTRCVPPPHRPERTWSR